MYTLSGEHGEYHYLTQQFRRGLLSLLIQVIFTTRSQIQPLGMKSFSDSFFLNPSQYFSPRFSGRAFCEINISPAIIVAAHI